MSMLVIEHVKVGDLPEAWRRKLQADADAKVTVRIESESVQLDEGARGLPCSAFGMWADHPDTEDVEAYVRAARAGRLPTRS